MASSEEEPSEDEEEQLEEAELDFNSADEEVDEFTNNDWEALDE